MALFFGIDAGQERSFAGLRVKISEDGERVWMHGKWLDLGEDHAVVIVEGKCRFVTKSGEVKPIGSFPAWVVRGSGKPAALALMTNISQFRGGYIRLGDKKLAVAD